MALTRGLETSWYNRRMSKKTATSASHTASDTGAQAGATMLVATGSTQQEMRVRAAWLYYVEGHNQADTARILGVNRLQVTRLLADARKRGEIKIKIDSELESVVATQREIERTFSVSRAILCPATGDADNQNKSISLAAGLYMSEVVASNMTIGVGWGSTLYSALPHITGRDLQNVRVISLLGGIAEARRYNPAEFAWQFAERFNGEGFLVPAPALVDSKSTRQALLEQCGINQIFEHANALDIAFISAGGIQSLNTSYRVGHLSEAERASLQQNGAVGDILYNFIDIDGNLVEHPVNDRSISVTLDQLRRTDNLVLISGGVNKVDVLYASLKTLKPAVFITDERTAESILALHQSQ